MTFDSLNTFTHLAPTTHNPIAPKNQFHTPHSPLNAKAQGSFIQFSPPQAIPLTIAALKLFSQYYSLKQAGLLKTGFVKRTFAEASKNFALILLSIKAL